MTDKELLELAAKATRQKILRDPYGQMRLCENADPAMNIFAFPLWNPLTDNGDALRLAVKLHIELQTYDHASSWAEVCFKCGDHYEIKRCYEVHEADPYAATRRAIVRAAAEIGKTL